MDFLPHLRSSFDDQKPSLFELLSEQQLSSLLPPTLRYLLAVATQRHPRYLLRILNSFDELYAVVSLLVERHYLLTRGGSFTENFYGLKRERGLAAEIPRASIGAPSVARDALRLRDGRDVWLNLMVLVGVPYVKRKLDEAYEVDAPRAMLGIAYNRLRDGTGPRERLVWYSRWFLRNVYPSVNAAYYFAIMAFNLAYLFDGSKYHHPLMWLIGTRVRRMTGADYAAVEALASKMDKGARPGRSMFSLRDLGPRVMSSLSVLLPVSIFALKFLEWWHASDFSKELSRKTAEVVDLPPPIVSGGRDISSAGKRKKKEKQADEEDKEDDEEKRPEPSAETAPIAVPSLLPILTVTPPDDSSLCPICNGEITTATACQTGIVFCYACIHRWIDGVHPRQEEFMADRKGRWESGAGRCAVTGRRVLGGTDGLRRIMV